MHLNYNVFAAIKYNLEILTDWEYYTKYVLNFKLKFKIKWWSYDRTYFLRDFRAVIRISDELASVKSNLIWWYQPIDRRMISKYFLKKK